MKLRAMVCLIGILATPAGAAVVHDEGVNGDLSGNEAAPTALAFALGGNTVIGTTGNLTSVDRDYLTFTVGAGQRLTTLNLLALSPDNLAFTAVNSGATSFIPSAATSASFLAGIHIDGSHVGFDLMPLFVSESITTNSLPVGQLGPGTYSLIMQQTSPITTAYSLEFVITEPVPVEAATWSRIKALQP